MKPTLLAIEAIAAAAPSVLAAFFGILVFLYSGFSMLSYDPLSGAEGIVVALGIAFALVQYGLLSSNTVYGKPYRFGWSFWIAVPFALYALRLIVSGSIGIFYALLIVCPIVLATLHFVVLQLQRSKRKSPESDPHAVQSIARDA
jgi:hypothetical protein